MASELRASIVVQLSDEADKQATEQHHITGAWEAFVVALEGQEMETSFTIGPVLDKPPRRRRGRPRLAVTEPPAAA